MGSTRRVRRRLPFRRGLDESVHHVLLVERLDRRGRPESSPIGRLRCWVPVSQRFTSDATPAHRGADRVRPPRSQGPRRPAAMRRRRRLAPAITEHRAGTDECDVFQTKLPIAVRTVKRVNGIRRKPAGTDTIERIRGMRRPTSTAASDRRSKGRNRRRTGGVPRQTSIASPVPACSCPV